MESQKTAGSRRVFISSRMAELCRDRAVVYEALVAHGWHPVLFEREPTVEDDVTKIDRMIEQCPRMVGVYYLTLGSATSLYKPLAAIEYELLGHLAGRCGRSLGSLRDRLGKHNPKELADEMLAEGAGVETLDLFVKAQRGFDSVRARKRSSPTPTLEEVLGACNFRESLVAHVLKHARMSGRVCVYHSTEKLFEHVLDRFPPRSDAAPEAVPFQFSLQGPDYVGLLSVLCQMLFERGVNIDWIHQTAANGVFLAALRACAGPRQSVDELVDDLARTIERESKQRIRACAAPAQTGSKGGYDYSYTCPVGAAQPARARLDIAASDTPGILAAITAVLAESGLNIEEISIGPEDYLGARQSHVRVSVSYPKSFGKDPDDWAKLHNALVSTIGVYGVTIRSLNPRGKA